MQIVSEWTCRTLLAGVLDCKLDTGFSAEDGRIQKVRVTRIACGGGKEDRSTRTSRRTSASQHEHEGEPVEAEESRDGAEQPGEEQKDGARSESGVAENFRGGPGERASASRARGSESESFFGQRRGGEHVGEDAIGIETFELGFGFEDEAMAKAGQRGLLDVVGNEEVAALFRGIGFGDDEEIGGGAGAGAEGDRRPLAGAAHDGEK